MTSVLLIAMNYFVFSRKKFESVGMDHHQVGSKLNHLKPNN